MIFNRSIFVRCFVLISLIASLTLLSTRLQADTGTCGGVTITLPFNDVMASPFFCQIAAAYYSGIANGTTATTYSPTQTVTREQMAAFTTRTLDQSLKRGSKRAIAQQWWQPKISDALRVYPLTDGPLGIAWDGTDLWMSGYPGKVFRVRASDGKLLETWTSGASGTQKILVAAGKVFITVSSDIAFPSELLVLDPAQPPGIATVFKSPLPPGINGITFDGQFIWTSASGSITRIPLTGGAETTFSGVFSQPSDILWDGENLWVAEGGANMVKRVDPATGAVLESIPTGTLPATLLFDGSNLWVGNSAGNSVTVIRAAGNLRGTVLATLTGNGLNDPRDIAFDGERVLVVNQAGSSVSLFKASDFSPLGTLSLGAGTSPAAACSDGLNFWITRVAPHDIVRY